jgi:D-3-phosphoglycerate dehydrogenase / 2-oxoglutarate reductase
VARVLVTERIAASGIDALRAAGHDVDEAMGLSPEELLDAVKGAAALIIRSATQVTAAVLAAGEDLIVVGRAGIGLDNVDVEAATARGVMVVNAPLSNVLSAAEQAMALLLAQARNIPQAHASLTSGKWERSRFEGVELSGKTLGVIGLGRVGALVAQRAMAFGMRLVAYDPFVSRERAAHMGVELLELDELMAVSDFVSIHLPKNASTIGLVDAKLLARAKPGQRLINTARGGIVVEEDLVAAIESGHIQGAGLDVFATEPCTESPLFELESVVVAPHLGASTVEAQDKAGVTIAEQVLLALDSQFVPFAVNVAAGEVSDVARPFMGLAEQLGRFFSWLHDDEPEGARRRGDVDPHALRAEGRVLGARRVPGLLRERAPARGCVRARVDRVVVDPEPRLRERGDGSLRDALRLGDARHRRDARRAEDRGGRRAHRRDPTGAEHARGSQRRPTRDDRLRRDRARARRGVHLVDGRRAERGERDRAHGAFL